MITVVKSNNADSRTKDNNFSRETLEMDTNSHIQDVTNGLNLMAAMLKMKGPMHDHTKLSNMNDFYQALSNGNVKETIWYRNHVTKERHHLLEKAPDDVNLLDVIECVVDCVMAGSARSGTVYPIEIPSDILQLAVANTVELLKRNISIVEPEKSIADQSVD